MKNTILILSVLAMSSTLVFGQVKTAEEYWRATQIKFEDLVYGNLNERTCQKTFETYKGCAYALSQAYNIVKVDKENFYFLIPDKSSSDPYKGFRSALMDEKEYEAILLNAYNNHKPGFLFLKPMGFKDAFAELSKDFKGKWRGTPLRSSL